LPSRRSSRRRRRAEGTPQSGRLSSSSLVSRRCPFLSVLESSSLTRHPRLFPTGRPGLSSVFRSSPGRASASAAGAVPRRYYGETCVVSILGRIDTTFRTGADRGLGAAFVRWRAQATAEDSLLLQRADPHGTIATEDRAVTRTELHEAEIV